MVQVQAWQVATSVRQKYGVDEMVLTKKAKLKIGAREKKIYFTIALWNGHKIGLL